MITNSQTGTELTIGREQVDVITANKVLGQTNNGARQRLFAVVVCRLLRDVPNQLGNLDLFDDFLLECAKQHFSLTRLETVGHGGDRADIVRHRKEDKLFVDKVRDGNLVSVVIEECTGLNVSFSPPAWKLKLYLELTKPLLAVIRLLFAKRHLDQFPVVRLCSVECQPVFRKI